MREVKFKVINEHGKEIGYDTWSKPLGWNHYYIDDPDELLHNATLPDEIINYTRFQFTGLQYRGVDVYEGMKFKFTYKDRERDENDEWKAVNIVVISTVEMVKGSWCVTEDGHDYKETMPCTLRQWIEDDDSELLGCENP